MRTSGLALAMMAVFGLCMVGGCDKKDEKKPAGGGGTTAGGGGTTAGGGDTKAADAAFKLDPWLCWASFDVGAWVEMDGGTYKMKTTITSKDDKEVKGERMGQKDQVLATKEVSTKCPWPNCDKKVGEHCHTQDCKKTGAHCCKCDKKPADHKKADEKWSKEDVKVGDQTVKCDVLESTPYDCDAKAGATSKMWYSKDVPGWMVKMESGATKMTAIGFGKK